MAHHIPSPGGVHRGCYWLKHENERNDRLILTSVRLVGHRSN